MSIYKALALAGKYKWKFSLFASEKSQTCSWVTFLLLHFSLSTENTTTVNVILVQTVRDKVLE